jgi:putative transcriptional regulator
VVLNRPSEMAVYNVLPQWAKLTARPKTMFVGGPVKRDSALCLGTLRVGADATGVPGLRHVDGRIVMVDLDADPDELAPYLEGVRIYAGYSGWTIGQLEGEIERDDWIVLSALPSDVLVEPRVDLWGRVLRRQPLPLSMLATHPIDTTRN